MRGNLAPEGAIVKSTAIARDLLDDDGVYRHVGPARVFTSQEGLQATIDWYRDNEAWWRPLKAEVEAKYAAQGQ